MNATVKNVNYTAEQTAKAIEDYKAGVPVKAIAVAVGKSTHSVISKLSREGVYKKKAYVAKDGSAVQSKADLVAEIANKLGVPAEQVGSLESATKAVLKMVAVAL